MKKIYILISVLLLTLFVVGCRGNTDETSKSESPTTKEHVTDIDQGNQDNQGKDVTVNATIPDGWENLDGAGLDMHYSKETASFMLKKEYFKGSTLDDIANEALDIFTSTFKNVEQIDYSEKVTIGGQDGIRIMFTCEIIGMEMKYEYIYVKANNGVYAFTFADLSDNFENVVGDFELIKDSIEFK